MDDDQGRGIKATGDEGRGSVGKVMGGAVVVAKAWEWWQRDGWRGVVAWSGVIKYTCKRNKFGDVIQISVWFSDA